MIGTIYSARELSLVHCPVLKTSNSGFSSNRRLAVLSIPDAIMGYISKVPEPLQQFNDPHCIAICKETVHLKTANKLEYFVSSSNHQTLVVRWSNEKQKVWEFKFESPQSAKDWQKYIRMALQSPQSIYSPKQAHQSFKDDQANTPLDYSKLRQTRSRFIQRQNEPNKQHEQDLPNTYRQPASYQSAIHLKRVQQARNTSRFQKHERQMRDAYQHERDLSHITTFQQKASSQNFISQYNSNVQKQSQQNWNIRWFEIIQRQSQLVRLGYYKGFITFCENTTIKIVNDLALLKKDRKFIPEKQEPNQETYNVDGVTFRLLLPNQLKPTPSNSNLAILKESQQELRNIRFILRATNNKLNIKVPLTCIVKYLGFQFFCQANPPPHFRAVEGSSLYVFNRDFLKLEQKLRVPVNKVDIVVYTDKPHGYQFSDTVGRQNLIVYNLKSFIFKQKIAHSQVSFWPEPELLLKCCPNFVALQDQKLQKNVEAQMMSFYKDENYDCTIISSEDLSQSLRRHRLGKELIYEMIKKVDNKYLYSIFASEIVAEYFEFFSWIRASTFSGTIQQNMDPRDIVHDNIYKTLSHLLIKNGDTWALISKHIFENHELVLKQQDIKIGYLFSSISLRMGIIFDYQLLLSHRPHYLQPNELIPVDCILSHCPARQQFLPEDMSQNHTLVYQKMSENQPSQALFQEIVGFYQLKTGEPLVEMNSYRWRTIARFLSEYVPFEREDEFSHLKIYEQTEPQHPDNQVFMTMVSAIRWLLLEGLPERVLPMLQAFRRDAWFWLGEINLFCPKLDELLANYYQSQGKFSKAMKHYSRIDSEIKAAFPNGSQALSLDRYYKEAKILKLLARHKQSLEKFILVHAQWKKQNRQSQILFQLLIQIAELYLHLGSVEKCLSFCKQAIDYSTFKAFANEERQHFAYQLVLRCLQILDDAAKIKFYAQIVEDKFGNSSNRYILQQVLRTTISQIISSLPVYLTKKMAYLLFCLEQRANESDRLESKDSGQLLRIIRRQAPDIPLAKLLRHYVDNCSNIVDEMSLAMNSLSSDNNHEEILEEVRLFGLLLQFIGVQYSLGQIAARLTSKK